MRAIPASIFISLDMMFFIAVAASPHSTHILASLNPNSRVNRLGECPRDGKQCGECNSVLDCECEDDACVPKSTTPCEKNSYCDALQTTPECKLGATCRYKEFECPLPHTTEEVIYPDPYSCFTYHSCRNGDLYTYYCPAKKAFDPKSKTCSITTDGPSCPSPPIKPCEKDGYTAAIADSDYIYVCKVDHGPPVVMYPEIRLKGDSTATPPVEASTTSPSPSTPTAASSPSTPTAASSPSTSTAASSPSTPTAATSPSTPTAASSRSTSSETSPTPTTATPSETTSTASPTTTTQKPFSCSNGAGVYADEYDCKSFYICYADSTGDLKWVHQTCRSGSHFDDTQKKCVKGDCSNNVTTTTERTGSTPEPGCTSEGSFANSTCCQCYYVCYKEGSGYGLRPFCCRGGSIFDPIRLRCVAGLKCTPCSTCPKMCPTDTNKIYFGEDTSKHEISSDIGQENFIGY